MKRLKVFVVLSVLSLLLSSSVFAEDLKVHFAGIAFRGNDAQISKNYKRTFKISEEKRADERGVLDAALADKVKNLKLKKGQIVMGELANLGDGSLTLACSIDTELVSVEQHDDGFKLVIDLGGQALLFDYGQMKIVASYPIMVELIDYLPEEPDEELIISRIRDLLLTDKYGVNLFSEFTEILGNVEIKQSYGNAMKVTDVKVEEKAFAHLPSQFKEDTANFQTFIAQNFGKFLSKNQGVSILPYTKGSDIGNKMAITFSDAKVFELAIPEPQFAIELTVRGFKKVCTEEKASGSCWVYGAYTRINVSQPALGKVYMDEKIKHAVSKVIPKSQKSVEDWPSYQNSLLALFNNVTKEFSTERKYKAVRKVVKKCS